MVYHCCTESRRSAILSSPSLNGIDYLELLDSDAVALDSPRQRTLLVRCLRPVPSGLTAANVLIEGGEGGQGIAVQWVSPASPAPPLATPLEQAYFAGLAEGPSVLVVRTDAAGDFSEYTLRLVNDLFEAKEDALSVAESLPGFDPQLAAVQFSFKVECGADLDCSGPNAVCSSSMVTPPQIDYLAKDYGSFRTLLLDRMNQLLPDWTPETEADYGVMLAELIAYAGDRLSYQQDAVATEAYLETARSRISLRRHARLVGYRVHEGCNARTWMQLHVTAQVSMDRRLNRFYTPVPGAPVTLAGNEEAALLAGVQVFEPMQDAVLYVEHNQMAFYTWGERDCCLPIGATEATLNGTYPNLHPGDVLIFKEAVSPQTGLAGDADLRHRCAVRLTQVVALDGSGQPLVDPLFEAETGLPLVSPAQKPAPITEIRWSAADALAFPLCLSSTLLDTNGDRQSVAGVSIVLGNVVCADHGLSFPGVNLGTVAQPRLLYPAAFSADLGQHSGRVAVPVRFRPFLPESHLTQAVPLQVGGRPVGLSAVMLSAIGPVSLQDGNGIVSLLLQARDLSRWPQSFGITVKANSDHAANFDLAVIYNAAPPVVLESLPNLSLNYADKNYAAGQINSLSRFISVPTSYVPPANAPAGFGSGIALLPNTGVLNLEDTHAVPYLTIQPGNPGSWARSFGVIAQGSQQSSDVFRLIMVYQPSSAGVGVKLPVPVEQFDNLTLATVAEQLNSEAGLFTVQSFAGSPDPDLSASDLMSFDPSDALPQISLEGSLAGAPTVSWTPRPDLLSETPASSAFVVEIESNGVATLRFGDDTNGMRPSAGTSFTASYRIGNGAGGNVGADSLVGRWADPRIDFATNPLPASGGVDPETAEQIRRRAPQASQTQLRAVTLQDLKAVAESVPRINQAVASMRWTGSWYTTFLTAEPSTGGKLDSALQQTLGLAMDRYRLAGQNLHLASPQYIPLEIELEVCILSNYFQRDVERALLAVLGSGAVKSEGKGLFSSNSFTFGQTIYLSPIYAATRSVAGVLSVTATRFQPQGISSNRFLLAGAIKLGAFQVARLENNPRFPDHGRFTLQMKGGI